MIADNIRLRARVGVLEEAVATLEAKLAEATATTGLWQYLLAGMGGALVLELLARPVWVRCTGRPYPLDQLLDKTVSPIVERALAASHLAWARILAAALYVLRRRQSQSVEVSQREKVFPYFFPICAMYSKDLEKMKTVLVTVYIYCTHIIYFKKNENYFNISVS